MARADRRHTVIGIQRGEDLFVRPDGEHRSAGPSRSAVGSDACSKDSVQAGNASFNLVDLAEYRSDGERTPSLLELLYEPWDANAPRPPRGMARNGNKKLEEGL